MTKTGATDFKQKKFNSKKLEQMLDTNIKIKSTY